MPLPKSLFSRQADQAKARERAAALGRKFASKPVGGKPAPPPPPSSPGGAPTPAPAEPVATPAPRAQHAWTSARAESTQHQLMERATGTNTALQPWAVELVDALLDAAESGKVTLLFAWPAKLTSLPLLHAVADMVRVLASDMRGVRTLLFPGTYASRACLQGVLADRKRLSDVYRSLWSEKTGKLEFVAATQSPSFQAALQALNDVRTHNPELPNPALAELIPVFVYDPVQRTWCSSAANALERTLSKVERLANRRSVRAQVGTEWSDPVKAPGALMVLHHSAKKEAWKTALSTPSMKGGGRPDVLLLDATHAAAQTNYSAVRRIPEFLGLARDNGLATCGAVIVTDDPRAFFAIRAQLHESKFQFAWRVFAAEADESIVSTAALPRGWKPEPRSNSNFSVGIVDRDASQVALTLQKLAADAGPEDSAPHQALLQAFMYILRLSNMPAGYSDLTSVSAAADGDYASQQNAWTPVKLRIDQALASGALNAMRDSVVRAVAKAESLIDAWSDSTPMGAKVLSEVRKHALTRRTGVSIVLPSSRYVLLAHKFLQRKLGTDWEVAESRIEWHTLSAVGRTLTGDLRGRQFIFVGLNPDVLRTLLTNPAVPNGTVVLIAYRQADATLKTLLLMKELDEFKSYRGRIGLLVQELSRRLDEVPNPVNIDRLRDVPMTFKFEEASNTSSGEQVYYRFELEGGGRAYASGWVYQYEPDEDPPFRRKAASSIGPADFIFSMSDELRTKLEASLQLNAAGASSVVDPIRMLLKLYHTDVQTRCALMFESTKRSALAREIHAKMVQIDPGAAECRPGRVYYWLELKTDGDHRPHAAKDFRFFKVFCKALDMEDAAAEQHWLVVRNARAVSQYLGRELVARYEEILFQPGSAMTYRKVPEATIRHLQQEALGCVFRVENIVPPPARPVAGVQKKGTAYAGAK